MSASRVKNTKVSFTDFKTTTELLRAYNTLASGSRIDTPLLLHNLYLLIEIACKKLSLHYELPVNTNSHKIKGYLDRLTSLNASLYSYRQQLSDIKSLRKIYNFDYANLRYTSNPDLSKYPTVPELVSLFQILIDWVRQIEVERGFK